MKILFSLAGLLGLGALAFPVAGEGHQLELEAQASSLVGGRCTHKYRDRNCSEFPKNPVPIGGGVAFRADAANCRNGGPYPWLEEVDEGANQKLTSGSIACRGCGTFLFGTSCTDG